MPVETAIAQSNPFEGLPFILAQEYQSDRRSLTVEEKRSRISGLMLASYFASDRGLGHDVGAPIDVFVKAIESAGGEVSPEQRQRYLKTVDLSHVRNGVIVEGDDGPELRVADDVFNDGSMAEQDRYRLLADKIKASQVAVLPMIDL